jgi:predicted TIM-barrel fold metal-dependent hydrolase
MDLGNPVHLDRIAMDFPTMKIVMCHAGSGFGLAPVWMAQRHPTIYLEFSALRHKYIETQVLQGMNGFLKKRILWGSDYPLMEFNQYEEWKPALKPEVFSLFTEGNAKALLATAAPK